MAAATTTKIQLQMTIPCPAAQLEELYLYKNVLNGIRATLSLLDTVMDVVTCPKSATNWSHVARFMFSSNAD